MLNLVQIGFFKEFLNTGECMIRSTTGYYCPGCGGTRAVIALLNGHPIQSFLYHPLVLYSVILIIYIISRFIYSKFNKSAKPFKFPEKSLYIALAIVLLNCVLKNILLSIGYLD